MEYPGLHKDIEKIRAELLSDKTQLVSNKLRLKIIHLMIKTIDSIIVMEGEPDSWEKSHLGYALVTLLDTANTANSLYSMQTCLEAINKALIPPAHRSQDDILDNTHLKQLKKLTFKYFLETLDNLQTKIITSPSI